MLTHSDLHRSPDNPASVTALHKDLCDAVNILYRVRGQEPSQNSRLALHVRHAASCMQLQRLHLVQAACCMQCPCFLDTSDCRPLP